MRFVGAEEGTSRVRELLSEHEVESESSPRAGAPAVVACYIDTG